MKRLIVTVAIAAGLTGCVKGPDSPAADALAHGRYAGIGTYVAGRLWQKMVVADPTKDPAAAKLADYDQVIVVVDSHTGEIRECGNLSGYCVGMNPWTAAPSASQAAPAKLTIHEDQLSDEPIKVRVRGSVRVHPEKPAPDADSGNSPSESGKG